MTYILYDNSNKPLKINKLNIDIKKKLINKDLKIKELNDKFKKDMSNDENFLPLFDLNSKKINFYEKSDIFSLIKYSHLRSLNDKLLDFLKDNKLNDLIKIVNLFDFNILEKLLVKFIYYNSKEIASDITYLKNPAYYEGSDINPYLKKSVILNIALNLNVIKFNEVSFYLSEKELKLLYNKIKNIIFDGKVLKSHKKIIYESKLSNLFGYYTLYGSYFINKYLRGNNSYKDNILVKQIKQIYNLISETPKLTSEYVVYRFLYDDKFLNLSEIGDTYVNESFMSCTRKPNISTEKNEFGLILLKIFLSNKYSGYFLSIESSSVYPNEKEVIIKPGVIFKVKSLDENVEFYLFDKKNTRNIKKKYELEIVGINKLNIPSYEIALIPEIDLRNLNLDGVSLEEKIDNFFKNYCYVNKCCYIIFSNKLKKLFYFNFYNSIDIYKKFYYYKISDGFFAYSFNESNQLDIFIEIGNDLIVNYPSKYLDIIENKDYILMSSLFCNIFKLSNILIFPYHKVKYDQNKNIKFNEIILDLAHEKISSFNLKINEFNEILLYLNSFIEKNNIHPILTNFISEKKSYKDFIKEIYSIDKLLLKYVNLSISENILNCHFIYSPYEYLISKDIISKLPSKFSKYQSKEFQFNINL